MGKFSAVILSLAVAALVVTGLVMLASTSLWVDLRSHAPEYYHLKRQGMWVLIGCVLAVIVTFYDVRKTGQWWAWIFLGTCVLLALCYVPGLGVRVNGELRWIELPLIGRVQPSEPGKIGTMLALCGWMARYRAEARLFVKGFLVPSFLIVVPVLLILFEKDFGTAVALGASGFALMFLAGTRLRYLGPTVLTALIAFGALVYFNANRMNRIVAFLDLEANRLGAGLQQWRAQLAFGTGGIWGVGLGNGAEKHGYLPFAHTDFIFAMAGEELGLIGTLGVVLCFVLIVLSGVSIGMHGVDCFGRLLAFGLTVLVVIPAIINVGVCTGMLPNTGLPLPFMSFGGSSMVFALVSVGMLISLHWRAVYLDQSELAIVKRKKLALKL